MKAINFFASIAVIRYLTVSIKIELDWLENQQDLIERQQKDVSDSVAKFVDSDWTTTKFLPKKSIDYAPYNIKNVLESVYFNISHIDGIGGGFVAASPELLKPILTVESDDLYFDYGSVDLYYIDRFFGTKYSVLSDTNDCDNLVEALHIRSDNKTDLEVKLEKLLNEKSSLIFKLDDWNYAIAQITDPNLKVRSSDVKLWKTLEERLSKKDKNRKVSKDQFLEKAYKVTQQTAIKLIEVQKQIQKLMDLNLAQNSPVELTDADKELLLKQFIISLFSRSKAWNEIAELSATFEYEEIDVTDEGVYIRLSAVLNIESLRGSKLYLSKILSWHQTAIPQYLDLSADSFWLASYIYSVALALIVCAKDYNAEFSATVQTGITWQDLPDSFASKYRSTTANYTLLLLGCMESTLHKQSIRYSPNGSQFAPITWVKSLPNRDHFEVLSRDKTKSLYGTKKVKSAGSDPLPSVKYLPVSTFTVVSDDLEYSLCLHYPEKNKGILYNLVSEPSNNSLISKSDRKNLDTNYIGDIVFHCHNTGSNTTRTISVGSLFYKYSSNGNFWGVFALLKKQNIKLNNGLTPVMVACLKRHGIKHGQFIAYHTGDITCYWQHLLKGCYPFNISNAVKITRFEVYPHLIEAESTSDKSSEQIVTAKAGAKLAIHWFIGERLITPNKSMEVKHNKLRKQTIKLL